MPSSSEKPTAPLSVTSAFGPCRTICHFPDDVHFEIGWQLDPQFVGNGYATEAAEKWLDHGLLKSADR